MMTFKPKATITAHKHPDYAETPTRADCVALESAHFEHYLGGMIGDLNEHPESSQALWLSTLQIQGHRYQVQLLVTREQMVDED